MPVCYCEGDKFELWEEEVSENTNNSQLWCTLILPGPVDYSGSLVSGQQKKTKRRKAFKQQKEFLVSFWPIDRIDDIFFSSARLNHPVVLLPRFSSFLWLVQFSSKWPKVFCQVIRWIDISIMFYQSQTKSHGINHELPFCSFSTSFCVWCHGRFSVH